MTRKLWASIEEVFDAEYFKRQQRSSILVKKKKEKSISFASFLFSNAFDIRPTEFPFSNVDKHVSSSGGFRIFLARSLEIPDFNWTKGRATAVLTLKFGRSLFENVVARPAFKL